MAEQTIQLHSESWGLDVTYVQWHPVKPVQRYEIISDLRSATVNRYFYRIRLYKNGSVEIRLGNNQDIDSSPRDLSSLFETDGSFTVEAGGFSVTVHMDGLDTSEPYRFTPSNSQDVTNFYNDLLNDGNAPYSGTLTLRDFEPLSPSFLGNEGRRLVVEVGDAIDDIIVSEATGLPPPLYSIVGFLPEGVSFANILRGLSFGGKLIRQGFGTITIRASNIAGFDYWTMDYRFITTTHDTDSIWVLGDPEVPPDTPVPSTGEENHTPIDWTRTEPDATNNKAVWKSQRGRIFINGGFSSADSWGDPERTENALILILRYIAIPSDRRLIRGTEGSLTTLKRGVRLDLTSNRVLFEDGDTIIDGDDPVQLGDDSLSMSSLVLIPNSRLGIVDNGIGKFGNLYSPGGPYDNRSFHVQIDSLGTILNLDSSMIVESESNYDRLVWDMTPQQEADFDTVSANQRVLIFITESSPLLSNFLNNPSVDLVFVMEVNPFLP